VLTLHPIKSSPIRAPALVWELTLSFAIVASTTVICSRVIHVNVTTVALTYLLGILAIATAWGRVQSLAASVFAMLCFNYFFLPPIGQFTIADPQNWVALFAFLATSLAGSELSDRAKRQTLEAKARQRETEQLYALSRSILLTDLSRPIGFQAAQNIAAIFDCRAVALYDPATGEVFRGGIEDLPEIEDQLKQVVNQGAMIKDAPGQVVLAAVTLGGRSIGGLALKGLTLSDGALQALLNLVAITLERARSEESASRAEAARQNEEFKSTLLDAIAHEFKTPLTSIKAASTSILSDPLHLSPEFHELATIIDEEADRLSLLVTEAVRMSQIDAGNVQLERERVVLPDLLRTVLQHFASRSEGREIRLQVSPDLPAVDADPELVSLALRQLIDNALKYSPPGSPIDILAQPVLGNPGIKGQVVIHVRDRGPGIPLREREQIFHKFYRRRISQKHVPGTGLGLYIAREIIRAHGGEVWVEGEPGAGSDFSMSLPVQVGVKVAPFANHRAVSAEAEKA
jgi:two-component system sensor histidine kinase KdpD